MDSCYSAGGGRCTIIRETFEGLARIRDTAPDLRWTSPFVLPFWMDILQKTVETGPPLLLSAFVDGGPIGIAPLMHMGKRAHLFGDPDVCDYLDMITVQGAAGIFFKALAPCLKKEGVEALDLMPLRPDSIVMTEMLPHARDLNMHPVVEEIDASYELPLPETWQAYLAGLTGHQRHEIRRRLRRLSEAGTYRFHEAADPNGFENRMDRFIGWFRRYHPGKKKFMDDRKMRFFKDLSLGLASKDMLRLFILEIDQRPVSMTLCIEYRKSLYLYNNAYDPRFEKLSVGTLGKVLSIREGILRRLNVFDFLKGEENYKRRLGGRRVPLFRCRIDLI